MLQLIASNSFLTVNICIAQEVGLDAAALLAELASSQIYWEQRNGLDSDGMFFETAEQIEEKTTLTAYQQAKAIKVLEEKGILKSRRKGVPAKKFFSIDGDKIGALFQNKFSRNLKTRVEETSKQEFEFFENINNKRDNNKRKTIKDINTIVSESSLSEPVKEKVRDFLEYRNEIKKPFKSERGIKSLITQIERQEQLIGPTAVIQVIDTSMQNQWQGLFWEKAPKRQEMSTAEAARYIDSGGTFFEGFG